MPPDPTIAAPLTAAGGRRMTEEQRERMRAAGRARFAALTPEQQEAQRARLRRGTPPPAPTPEGRPSVFPDPARAAAEGARAGVGTNGHDRAAGPPIFQVPDLPPLETGDAPLEGDPAASLVEPAGIAVTEAQVDSLLRFPFELIALRRGKHWKLRDDEAAMLAGPLARKINENAIAARAIAAGGDWAVIVGGFSIVVSARLMEDRERATRDESGASGVPPARGQRDRGATPRPDGPRAGGALNGFQLPGGPGDAADADAVGAEAPGAPLVQAF